MTGNGNDNSYEFAGFRFDRGEKTLWQNGAPIALSPKALELLGLLLERRGGFVSKQEIFDTVWAGTFVEDGVLSQNIYTLRKALGESVIENRIRRGYRMTVPVEGGSPEANVALTSSKWTKLMVAVVAAALMVSTVALIYFFRSSPVETALENISFQKITDTGNLAITALSPDGNFAAYTRTSGVFIKDLKTSAETKLNISNVDRPGHLQFSRDGAFLFLRDPPSVYLPSRVSQVSRHGGEAVVVAENVWSNFSLSPDEKQIAFMRRSLSEGKQGLFVKDLTSGEERELLSLSQPQQFGLQYFPGWSPDGKRLVVSTQQQPAGFLKLILVDILSGSTEDIVLKDFQDVEQVVWLPQRNALLAVARKGKNFQLWEIGLPDKTIKRVTNDINDYHSLSISADGTRILTLQLTFFANLWVMDEADPADQKQLTFGTSNLVGWNGIDYLGSGDIVYSASEDDSLDVNLWRVNAESGARQKLTDGAGSQNRNPSVSPGDEYIYFSSNRGGKAHIWRIEAGGAAPVQITFSDAAEMFPQVSPDGEFLYFIRKDKQSSAIWQRSLASGEEKQITDGKLFSPSNLLELSPDGKLLGFQNLTDQRTEGEAAGPAIQIVVIEVGNPQNTRVFEQTGGKAEIIWARDGQYFDYIKPATVKDRDEIWRTRLDVKTDDKAVMEFPKDRVFNLTRSVKGTTIAVSRGQRQHDAVLLSNFK